MSAALPLKVLALVSGGKDSTYAVLECLRENHDVVCLGNLEPVSGVDELDSFMYQTVGHQGVHHLSEAMELPLLRKTIQRQCTCGDIVYEPNPADEVEDLYELILEAKNQYNINAVCSGAIASTYQRTRVESVCSRLNLTSLAYLWKRDQLELLAEMAEAEIDAILVKIAGIGLTAEKHLGAGVREITPDLEKFNKSFGINPCGEGGEFETFTLDACYFTKKIVIDEKEIVEVDTNDVCPVAYINILKAHCEAKHRKDPYFGRIDRSFLYEMPELDILPSEVRKMTLQKDSVIEKPINQVGLVKSERIGNFCFCFATKSLPDDSDDMLSLFLDLLSECQTSLKSVNSSLESSVCVYLYIPDMKKFSFLNEVYSTKFANIASPPSRSCVENSSGKRSISMNVISKWEESDIDDRRLYVRSISHWAPANIGPYSQYVSFEGVSFVSGQIPMVPATLDILDSKYFFKHARMSLHHAQTIIKEIFPGFKLVADPEDEETNTEMCISSCICYVTSESYFKIVKQIWEILKMPNDSLLIVQVSALPKGACIEWEFICIDRAINESFSVLHRIVDNVEKFLADSSEVQPNGFLDPSRVFVKTELLQDKSLDLESRLISLFGDVPCCLVPVEQIYNGSLALCCFQIVLHV